MARAAAIYCRISDDRAGTRAGVRRQEEDCRALVERRRWRIAGVYVDNDVSAWSGKVRPQYRKMLEDIRTGIVEAVVVWHQDRLVRHPKELEEFFEICDAAGVRDMATVTGDVDLGNDDGRFHARILGAVARKESDDKSRRIRRKIEELAKEGRRSGGGTRPFGFQADRVSINREEAKLVQEAAARVLAGESLRGICRDWTRRDIPTVTGVPWTPIVVKRILIAPRTAGLRQHRGVVVAKAEWPAIIDRDSHDRLNVILGDPRRRLNGGSSARKYLLTGHIFCELCGAKLIARPKADGRRCYVCATGPGNKGCGKIRSLANPVEELVGGAISAALDGGVIANSLNNGNGTSQEQGMLLESIRSDDQALAQLARDHYAERLISRSEFMAARSALDERIERARTQLARLESGRVLRHLPETSAEFQRLWDEGGLDWRRAMVEATLEKVVLAPAVKGRNFFDPARVKLVWKN
jgi:site-specific DNA recombinase